MPIYEQRRGDEPFLSMMVSPSAVPQLTGKPKEFIQLFIKTNRKVSASTTLSGLLTPITVCVLVTYFSSIGQLYDMYIYILCMLYEYYVIILIILLLYDYYVIII